MGGRERYISSGLRSWSESRGWSTGVNISVEVEPGVIYGNDGVLTGIKALLGHAPRCVSSREIAIHTVYTSIKAMTAQRETRLTRAIEISPTRYIIHRTINSQQNSPAILAIERFKCLWSVNLEEDGGRV